MRARLPIAAVAVVLAAAGLTGCRTNVGTAATVDGTRISENSVNSYVRAAGQSASFIASETAQGETVPAAKVIIVQNLIEREVFRRALAANGGVPTASQLAAAGRGTNTASIRSVLPQVGINASFVSVIVEGAELETVLRARLKIDSSSASADAETAAAVQRAGVKVTLNSRYGSWVPAELGIDSSGSLPSYLTLHSDAAQPGATG